MCDRVETMSPHQSIRGALSAVIGRVPASGEVQLLLASILAGSGWLFSVNALNGLPPLSFIGSRFMLAGLMIYLVMGLPSLRALRSVWKNLLLSSVAMAAAMTLWIVGLKHTSHIGVAAFITATGNLMVPLAGVAMFRWRLARRSLISLAVSGCGLALLFLNADASFAAPDVLFLISAVLWAVSLVLVREKTRGVSAAATSAVQLFCTGGIVSIGAAFLEDLPTAIPTASTLGWFLASVVLSTCLRFVLQFQGQSRTVPAKAGMMMIFEPVWAMVFAFLFVGTPLSPVQAVGCAIIFAAVAREALAKSAPGG
ncbi:DMT family transporter [Agrobacterium sp. NPDC090273]|uniref:DMT family transporter n=1 Tax=Agrobacterium sp. NPDC090273 TaxID=3363919 RepID=UPI00383B3E7A